MTSAEVNVSNASGLHARPAATFAKAAARFHSEVRLENLTSGRPSGNAKSILGVLASGVESGHRIRITAQGDDEAQAVPSLVALIEGGLGESVGG